MEYAHFVESTPVLDTSAYAAGDHMSDVATVITGATNARPVKLASIAVLDKDDQGAAFDVLLFKSSPTVASSKNAALNISDAEMENCVGYIPIASGDYADFGGARIAQKNLEQYVKPDGEGKIYYLLVARGTPTHTASGLTLKFYFEAAW